MSLSVLIPIWEPEPWLQPVLNRVRLIQHSNPGLVLELLTEREGSLWEARRSLAERARAPFIFNLDADSLVPVDYPARALAVLKKDPFVGAVALNYLPKPQFHLAFGTSIMRRDVMLKWYGWSGSVKSGTCECLHMWRQLDGAGYVLATLPLEAYHKSKKRAHAIPTERSSP